MIAPDVGLKAVGQRERSVDPANGRDSQPARDHILHQDVGVEKDLSVHADLVGPRLFHRAVPWTFYSIAVAEPVRGVRDRGFERYSLGISARAH